jgi:MoxR-like ATPase
MQNLVRQVPVAEYLVRYAAKLVRFTRPGEGAAAPIAKYVSWGAGPRAGQSLILAAKARALLHGRPYVALEDIHTVAAPVLRHRIITNYNAEADRVTADLLVTRLIESLPRDAA